MATVPNQGKQPRQKITEEDVQKAERGWERAKVAAAEADAALDTAREALRNAGDEAGDAERDAEREAAENAEHAHTVVRFAKAELDSKVKALRKQKLLEGDLYTETAAPKDGADDEPEVGNDKVLTHINEKKRQRDERRRKFDEDVAAARRSGDFIKAATLQRNHGLNFTPKSGSNPEPAISDRNIRIALDAIYGDGFNQSITNFHNDEFETVNFKHYDGSPFCDTFSSKTVGTHGFDIIKGDGERLSIFDAVVAIGLEMVSISSVVGVVKEWCKQRQSNSLTNRVWRATESMRESLLGRFPDSEAFAAAYQAEELLISTALIRVLRCRDTPENRMMSAYFFMSLFSRLILPGCPVPVSLFMVGAQDAGKTRFGKEINGLALDTFPFDPPKMEFSGDKQTKFLRSMHGSSVIAEVGEMISYMKAEVEEMKEFISRDFDHFDEKYAHTENIPRQWVAIMNGNKMAGFQNDDTGNRRWFPMVVCQVDDDEAGHVQWAKGGKMDIDWLKEHFWEMMAECRSVYEVFGDKYFSTVMGPTMVQTTLAVNAAAMERDEGSKGGDFAEGIDNMLEEALARTAKHRTASGLAINAADLHKVVKVMVGEKRMANTEQQVCRKVTALALARKKVWEEITGLTSGKPFGGEIKNRKVDNGKGKFTKQKRVYEFEGIKSQSEFVAIMLDGDFENVVPDYDMGNCEAKWKELNERRARASNDGEF